MKVALFTDTYIPQINGVALTTKKLADYFKKNNIQYKVLAPSSYAKDIDINVIRYLSIKFLLYPECRLSIPAYHSMSKIMNDFNPDIIHVMTPINIGLCGMKYAKDYDIPLVSHYHTNFDQYLKYYNLKFIDGFLWKYFRWFHEKCDKNYCPSYSSYQILKNKGIYNFQIVNNGIDTNEFSPKYRDINFRKKYNIDNKIVILFVGRFAAEKDIDVFIDVVKKLNIKYESDIHFLMVGDGPMKSNIIDANIPNLTLTGFLRGEDLAKVYASSEIFFFPSSTETYGNVILEAMASGLATVACKKGGILENVVHGQNGLLSNEKDVQGFYNALESLILDENLRNKFSQNGLKQAESKSWDNIFDTLVENYEYVISHHRKSKNILA